MSVQDDVRSVACACVLSCVSQIQGSGHRRAPNLGRGCVWRDHQFDWCVAPLRHASIAMARHAVPFIISLHTHIQVLEVYSGDAERSASISIYILCRVGSSSRASVTAAPVALGGARAQPGGLRQPLGTRRGRQTGQSRPRAPEPPAASGSAHSLVAASALSTSLLT